MGRQGVRPSLVYRPLGFVAFNNENKIPRCLRTKGYAFSRVALRKSGFLWKQ
jgi:hypothetical protein